MTVPACSSGSPYSGIRATAVAIGPDSRPSSICHITRNFMRATLREGPVPEDVVDPAHVHFGVVGEDAKRHLAAPGRAGRVQESLRHLLRDRAAVPFGQW